MSSDGVSLMPSGAMATGQARRRSEATALVASWEAGARQSLMPRRVCDGVRAHLDGIKSGDVSIFQISYHKQSGGNDDCLQNG